MGTVVIKILAGDGPGAVLWGWGCAPMRVEVCSVMFVYYLVKYRVGPTYVVRKRTVKPLSRIVIVARRVAHPRP